jgi:hypothetical protein
MAEWEWRGGSGAFTVLVGCQVPIPAGTVEKVHAWLASMALPARSRMPVVRVPLYWAPKASPAAGVKENEVGLNLDTDPATAVLLCVWTTLNVDVVTLEASMLSLKVAVITASLPAQEDAFGGELEATLGGVVSGTAPVVKLQLRDVTRRFPAVSRAPVVIVAV